MIKFENIRHISLKKDFIKVDGTTTVKTLIKNMRNRINEISDFHPYPKISEGSAIVDDKLFARGVAFQIKQDAENKAGHMLEVSVLHPHKQVEYTRPLAYGNKNTIADYLNNDRSQDAILKEIDEMCAAMKSE